MSQHMIVEIGKKEESEQLSSGAPGTIKYPGEDYPHQEFIFINHDL